MRLKKDSIVTKDSILNLMLPLTEGNAKVEHGGAAYLYFQYVENSGYTCNESYWCPLYEASDPKFEYDKDAVEHLKYLRENTLEKEYSLLYPNVLIPRK